MTNPQKTRCRFDAFVKIKPGIPSHYPGLKRTWCHRGDKFTEDEKKMLPNLVKMINRKLDTYSLVELYDNRLPMDSESRLILKISDGVIEKNRLPYYREYLKTIPLPDHLKALINENQTNQG